MQILKDLETAPLPLEEEERRHTRRLMAGVLFALLVTGSILGGFFYLRTQHESQTAKAVEEAKTKAPPLPQVEVFVDEPEMKDKQTVLGGTVHNISKSTLSGIAIRLELRRRGGAGVDTRTLNLEQSDLAADGSGRYAVSIAASDYSNSKVVAVIAGSAHGEIPFRTLPGALRPPEPPPANKTIVVKRPAPKGDEFINTPDNPGRIR